MQYPMQFACPFLSLTTDQMITKARKKRKKKMRRSERYKELGISSDFMFAKVMRKPELCRKLLEVILREKIERI